MKNIKKEVEEIINEFESEFCNNHQKPIRFLRSIFYDEQDGAEQIELFIKKSLTRILKDFAKLLESLKAKKFENGYWRDISAKNETIAEHNARIDKLIMELKEVTKK